MPDCPAVSSADPTLYQIMCVTTGARWSGITATCMPFERLNETAFGAMRGIAAVASAGAGLSAKAGTADIVTPNERARDKRSFIWGGPSMGASYSPQYRRPARRASELSFILPASVYALVDDCDPVRLRGRAGAMRAGGQDRMRRVDGLMELASGYGALLCDVWGVLHNGVTAFPAAVDAIRRFRHAAGPVILITNAPRPNPSVRLQLRQLGVPDDAYDELVTSGDVTRALIAERPGVRLLHIGPERDMAFYEGLDVALSSEADADLLCCTGLTDDTVETPDDYRALLSRCLDRGLPMICANPDLVVERGDRLIYCAGALARLYVELGGEAVLVGKPYPPIYVAAKRQLEERGGARPLAVGDGLPTDIRGAVDNDLPVLFVTGGIHAADFGPPTDPDGARVEARLKAEGLSAVAYVPALRWDGAETRA